MENIELYRAIILEIGVISRKVEGCTYFTQNSKFHFDVKGLNETNSSKNQNNNGNQNEKIINRLRVRQNIKLPWMPHP